MKGQKQLLYALRITYITSHQSDSVYSFGGSLRRVLDLVGDACYELAEPLESYHTVRRELLRTAGAYAKVAAGRHGLLLVTIIEQSLLEKETSDLVPADYVSPHTAIQAADLAADSVVYSHPSRYSGFASSPSQLAPVVEPTPLDILIAQAEEVKEYLASNPAPVVDVANQHYHRVKFAFRAVDGKKEKQEDVLLAYNPEDAAREHRKKFPIMYGEGRVLSVKVTRARFK